MRARGVVIGAGNDAVHTIITAKKQGIYVIAIDGNPNAEGFKYADEIANIDISNPDMVCEYIKEKNIDFTIPVPIGRYLSTMGYVNTKLGLPGAGRKATEYSTDKFIFHKLLNGQNLRNIKCYLINKDTDIEGINISYPAILKPRFGSGSRDVFYINNCLQCKKSVEKVKEIGEEFVLEQAVEGIEYSIDGAVINGKLVISLLRKKYITPLPNRQPIASYAVSRNEEGKELYSRVQQKLQKVVEVLEYNNCIVNADLIINDNDVFVIEIAPRPSGHNLHNVFVPLATGIDIAKEYQKFLLQDDYDFYSNNIHNLWIKFFDFSDGCVKKVPSSEQICSNIECKLIRWECNIVKNEYLKEVVNGHSIMPRGYFILEGSSEEVLIEQSKRIMDEFDFEIVSG